MDTIDHNKKKKPGWWQTALIGTFSALGAPFAPVLALAPGFLAYLGVAGGIPMLLAAAGGCLALTWVLYGTFGMWMLCAMLPGAFLLTLLLRSRATYFDTALYLSAVSTAGLYAMYGLPDILAGHEAFYSIRETFLAISKPLSEQMTLAGLDTATVEQYIRTLSGEIYGVMPALLCIMGAMTGLFSLLVCRALSKRAGAPVKEMRPFAFWAVPNSAAQGTAILLAGLFLCNYLLKLPAMDAIIPAAIVVALTPFVVQGGSVMWFMLMLRRPGCLSRAILIGILILTFPYSVFTCGTLGVIEQFLHLRRRLITGVPPEE